MQNELDKDLRATVLAAYEAGDLVRVRELTEEAILRRPDWVEARVLHAYAVQDESSAMDEVEWALEREPHNVDALRMRARLRANGGNLESALTDIELAYSLAPDNFDVLSEAAYLLLSMGRYEEALGYAEAMEAIEPDRITTCACMGEVLLNLGYFELALDRLTLVTAQEDSISYGGLMVTKALFNLRQYEVAGDIIDGCATQDPESLVDDDWMDLAEIRLELGQVETALECLHRARESEQTGPWLAIWGRAQLALGNDATGLDALDRAIRELQTAESTLPGIKAYNIAWCHAYRAMLARQYGLHLIDVQAERSAACAMLRSACADSEASIRFAQATPAFDPLWSMPELEGLAGDGGRQG